MIRFPHPEVMQILDLRTLLDAAASISPRYAAARSLRHRRRRERAAGRLRAHSDLFGGQPEYRRLRLSAARGFLDAHSDLDALMTTPETMPGWSSRSVAS